MEPKLIDGTHYVQSDAGKCAQRLSAAITTMGRLTLGIVALFIIAFASIIARRVAEWPAGFVLVCGALAVTLYISIWRQLKTRLHNVNDTIFASGGGIVISKPDGRRMSFSPSARRRWTSGFLGGKRFEVWSESGQSYLLDRSNLTPLKPDLRRGLSEPEHELGG